MKKQLGGGVYYRGENLDKILDQILQPSSFFINGSFSLIFKCDVSKMPFIETNLNEFGKKPGKLLIKLGVIYESYGTEFTVSKFNNNNKRLFRKDIFSQTKEDFDNEVSRQNECYNVTSKYLQGLCPNIIYSNLINVDSFKHFKFEKKNNLIINPEINPMQISVIIMENMNDSYSMDFYMLQKYDNKPEEIEKRVIFHNMARYAIIEYALMTGCVHRDLGLKNILMSPEHVAYYVGDSENVSLVGRPSLIDFSSAKFILGLKEKISTILQSESETKFTDALIEIGNIEKSLLQYPIMQIRYNDWEYSGANQMSGYGWVFEPKFWKTTTKNDDLKTKIEKTNNMLSNIHTQRENSKKPKSFTFEKNQINLPIEDENKFVDEIFPIQILASPFEPYANNETDEDFVVKPIIDVDTLFDWDVTPNTNNTSAAVVHSNSLKKNTQSTVVGSSSTPNSSINGPTMVTITKHNKLPPINTPRNNTLQIVDSFTKPLPERSLKQILPPIKSLKLGGTIKKYRSLQKRKYVTIKKRKHRKRKTHRRK